MAKKEIFKILKDDGTMQVVEGYIVNEIWGIDKRKVEYGKRIDKDGTEHPLSFTAYFITHIPTGKHLRYGTCNTLKNAKLLLQEPEFFDNPLRVADINKAVTRFAEKVGWNY